MQTYDYESQESESDSGTESYDSDEVDQSIYSSSDEDEDDDDDDEILVNGIPLKPYICECMKAEESLKTAHFLRLEKLLEVADSEHHASFLHRRAVVSFASRTDPRALLIKLEDGLSEPVNSINYTSGRNRGCFLTFPIPSCDGQHPRTEFTLDVNSGLALLMRRSKQSGFRIDPIILPDCPGVHTPPTVVERPFLIRHGFVGYPNYGPIEDGESSQRSDVVDGKFVFIFRQTPSQAYLRSHWQRAWNNLLFALGTSRFDASDDGTGYDGKWVHQPTLSKLALNHLVDEHFVDYKCGLLFMVSNGTGEGSFVQISFSGGDLHISGAVRKFFDLEQICDWLECHHRWKFQRLCMISHRRMFIAQLDSNNCTMLILMDYAGNVIAKTFLRFAFRYLIYHPVFHTIAMVRSGEMIFVDRLESLFSPETLVWRPSSHFLSSPATRRVVKSVLRLRSLVPGCPWGLMPNELLFIIFEHL